MGYEIGTTALNSSTNEKEADDQISFNVRVLIQKDQRQEFWNEVILSADQEVSICRKHVTSNLTLWNFEWARSPPVYYSLNKLWWWLVTDFVGLGATDWPWPLSAFIYILWARSRLKRTQDHDNHSPIKQLILLNTKASPNFSRNSLSYFGTSSPSGWAIWSITAHKHTWLSIILIT